MKRINVDRARSLRTKQTDAEQHLWRRLRNRQPQGWKFRRQHEIDRYIVDFACPDAALVVELDGSQRDGQMAYDEVRTRKLENLGYRVLRFWDNDVLTDIEGVLEAILEALASPAPHPDPLPGGEREQGSRET
ncbi:endonuclease domain-containing protein [Fulvimonas soli]|jgi:very-short-patch-repair endonuclease|uniref:Very-short-patch-repair endonuclease n=1 Tax=Fulvimonas soli TaxID=155197 RepID=A0A316HW36_9GAMM|nr:endonuclease domain-containing protein [Fulvimonas soli]PWK84340.1 very-short-patch-repair endonuclease [Fulvimonas soli]TNY26671.1 DNA methylase [Fulvimonas soli]